jgi:hypothetical protein
MPDAKTALDRVVAAFLKLDQTGAAVSPKPAAKPVSVPSEAKPAPQPPATAKR